MTKKRVCDESGSLALHCCARRLLVVVLLTLQALHGYAAQNPLEGVLSEFGIKVLPGRRVDLKSVNYLTRDRQSPLSIVDAPALSQSEARKLLKALAPVKPGLDTESAKSGDSVVDVNTLDDNTQPEHELNADSNESGGILSSLDTTNMVDSTPVIAVPTNGLQDKVTVVGAVSQNIPVKTVVSDPYEQEVNQSLRSLIPFFLGMNANTGKAERGRKELRFSPPLK